MIQVCAACGFEQEHRTVVCERCNKPLVFPRNDINHFGRKKERPAVDPRVYDLAEDFLSELGATEDEIWELARMIQIACEDACNEVESRQEPKETP